MHARRAESRPQGEIGFYNTFLEVESFILTKEVESKFC